MEKNKFLCFQQSPPQQESWHNFHNTTLERNSQELLMHRLAQINTEFWSILADGEAIFKRPSLKLNAKSR